ncbi:MerR family DNA-binding protein [Kosakonia cowanii]
MPKPSAGYRRGLRRHYSQSVLNKLQLIVLGQAAGFSLDEMAAMLNPQGRAAINREQLQQRAKAIDETICKLQLFSEG